MSATPTERQYRLLLALGSGGTLVVGSRRQIGPLVRRGWVTATDKGDAHYPYAWVRIRPDGLRALALAVEKHGLPEMAGGERRP